MHLPMHLPGHGIDFIGLPVWCCIHSCLGVLFRMRRAGVAGRALGLQLPAFVPACWRLCMVQTWSFQVRFCLAPSNLPLPHQCCGALSLAALGQQRDTGICLPGLQAHKALLGLPSGCHQCEGRPWHRSSCSEIFLCTPCVMPMYTMFMPCHCVSIFRKGPQASA